jgi:cycloeucalenol cycloisomerase
VLSPNPERRAVERVWLAFTPIWGLLAAVVMLSGAAERWGDGPLMALGVGLALGAIVPPLWISRRESRPWHQRTAVKLVVAVTGLALGMNYLCTPYFFDVLHMHYGFAATIAIEHNPVFLYLMTVAYFATYFVLVCAVYRFVRQKRGPAIAAGLAACLGVAALETLLNANPFMTRLFCFDDMRLMLWFGTLSYGSCFAWLLPAWLRIDDAPGAARPLGRVLFDLALGLGAITVTFAALRHFVAPHLTTVHAGANGLRDFAGSCLSR